MNFNQFIKEEKMTQNFEGGEAFPMSPEMELYTAAVTTLLSDKFYERDKPRAERIAELVAECPAEFVAKLAVYTRHEMNLRSVPLLLLVELARVHSGDNLVSRSVAKTVARADEIMELLMCYQWRNYSGEGQKKLGKLSRQIQVGLQHSFNRFDEYQFAKYNRKNLEVKLRDALFLTHPKAKDQAQQEIFDKIAADKLATPYTWETELSALGEQEFESDEARSTAFRGKWEELIDSGNLGYMALLRNLRNILQSEVSVSHINKVIKSLTDPNAVRRSKQLPFRFLSAYREIQSVESASTSILLSALEEAVMVSAMNIEGFDESERLLLACDVSGSMQCPVSRRSTVQNYDIGLLLAMLLQSRCHQVISGMFGDEWKVVSLPSEQILANTLELHRREGEVGYSTNGYKVIEWLLNEHKVVDRVMIFTDCQLWDSSQKGKNLRNLWRDYKRYFSPEAKLYIFDLAGYGASPISLAEGDVYLVGGWSDKVFKVLRRSRVERM